MSWDPLPIDALLAMLKSSFTLPATVDLLLTKIHLLPPTMSFLDLWSRNFFIFVYVYFICLVLLVFRQRHQTCGAASMFFYGQFPDLPGH